MAQLNEIQTAALTNIFDDDPRLRQKYLEKHGFEMNPKDPNQYKSIGSPGEYMDIDPGFMKQWRENGWHGFAQEAMTKLKGNALNLGVTYPLIGGAAMSGALEGLAGGPVAPLTSMALSTAQGAAMSATLRVAKHALAEQIAGSEVPVDKEQLMYTAFMDGAMPKIMSEGIGPAAKKGLGFVLDKVRGVSNTALTALQKSLETRGGNIEVLTKIAQNPKLVEGAKIAEGEIKSEYRKLFGIELKGMSQEAGESLEDHAANSTSKDLVRMANTPAERIPRESQFGKRLGPLMDQQEAAVDSLSKDPKANFKLSEFLDPMVRLRNQLVSKFEDNKILSESEQDALNILNQRIDGAKKAFMPEATKTGKFMVIDGEKVPIHSMDTAESPPTDPELNYRQARNWLKAIQEQVFEKNDMGTAYKNPGAPLIAQAIGGGEDQLGKILDQKAASLGSDLPQTNAQISNLATTYDSLKKTLSPQQIATKFMPGSKDWKDLIPQTQIMDQVLGLTGTPDAYTPKFENLATSNWIGGLSKNVAQGSSSVNATLAEAGKLATAGSALSHAPGVGPLLDIAGKVGGVLKAGEAASSADKEAQLMEYIAQSGRNAAPEGAVSAGIRGAGNAAVDLANIPVRAAVGENIAQKNQPNVPIPEADPFAVLDEHPAPGPAPSPAPGSAPGGAEADPFAILDTH